MKIKIWVDKKYEEPEIVICTDRRTQQTDHIRKVIEDALNATIVGYTEQGARVLACQDIIRIYAEGDRVMAQCPDGLFMLKEKLYELEEGLDPRKFVRISRSELVNLGKIKRLDTKLTGTIRIYLQGDIETYVSRRNVTRIKKLLGV